MILFFEIYLTGVAFAYIAACVRLQKNKEKLLLATCLFAS